MRTIACTAVFFFVTLALANSPKLYAQADSITPAEARAIAKEAYIYGFPVVDNYRIMHSYFVDRNSGEFKADWNHIHNEARVYTPQDRAIQTPNSDTPYSQLGTNLLVEPLVITVPEVPKDRYYSLQFIDLYTFNYAYVGSRATMNEPGNYLLTGPIFASPYIDNIKKIIRCETQLGFVLFRTQLLNPNDIAGVEAVQAGYKVQTLSQFHGKKGPDPRPIDFIKPLTAQEQRTSLDFYKVLSFALSFCPPHPSEDALIARFAKLKIGPSGKFDPSDLSPEIKAAVEQGMAEAWQEFAEYKRTQIDTGKRSSADGFGTREYLKNDYMARMASAVLGIYGNSKEEALYPVYFVDADGQKLSGTNKYTLHFGPNQLPPVNAFWSLTMYKLPESLLVENPINRYLINSPMLPDLKRDADGGLTLYVQHDSPGNELQSNWLPAPEGDFFSVLRLYWPKDEALNGKWTAPPMQRVKAEASPDKQP